MGGASNREVLCEARDAKKRNCQEVQVMYAWGSPRSVVDVEEARTGACTEAPKESWLPISGFLGLGWGDPL